MTNIMATESTEEHGMKSYQQALLVPFTHMICQELHKRFATVQTTHPFSFMPVLWVLREKGRMREYKNRLLA
jgi:hypothetical protein